MRPLRQVCKKVKAIYLYLIYYFLCSSIIIVLFGWIYSTKNILNPWQISFEIFWGIENHKLSSILYEIYAERIINDLFSLIFAGTILIHFLEPINPILFSNYVAYDTVDRNMAFRYWIMLPKNQYLYNVKIRLFFTDYESHQQGVNRLKTLWKIDENGTTYHGWRKYKEEDILIGYRYVPLQRHSYETRDFFRENHLSDEEKRLINPSEDFYQAGKKEFFRY